MAVLWTNLFLLYIASSVYCTFQISFEGKGKFAHYQLLPVEQSDIEMTTETAFFRRAKVSRCYSECLLLAEGSIVTLKIAKKDFVYVLDWEGNVYKAISERTSEKGIPGIPVTDNIGWSTDISEEENFKCPEGEKQGKYFILVTQFLGQSLAEFKYNKNLQPNALSNIFSGVTTTIEKLEKIGVTHRNINLRNIFYNDTFEPSKSVLVANFGFITLHGKTAVIGEDRNFTSYEVQSRKAISLTRDDKVSAVLCAVATAWSWLPWYDLWREYDNALPIERKKIEIEILKLKQDFDLNLYPERSSEIPDDLRITMMNEIQAARNDKPKEVKDDTENTKVSEALKTSGTKSRFKFLSKSINA